MQRNFTTRCEMSVVALALAAALAASPFDVVDAKDRSKRSAQGIPAKEKLAVATNEAQKWQKDAMLVGVETRTATPVGRAFSWIYLFNSAGIKEQTIVMVDDKGKVSRLPSPSFNVYRNAVGEFVDSEQAMAEAVKNGFKSHDFGMIMGLKKDQRAEWQMLDKSFFYYVDAGTGKFLRKEKND